MVEKGNGSACPNEYALRGNQVEPRSGYWNFCPQLRLVHIDELQTLTEDPSSPFYFPPYPTDEETVEREFAELLALQEARDNPCDLVADDSGAAEDTNPAELPGNDGLRRPISRLLNISPPPLGAVLVNRFPGEQIIRTGRGMARAVENETPGLYHRHALNLLLPMTNWSPPRHALVWAALDVAIASALQAAWFYKWIAVDKDGNFRDCTARRERPTEYDARVNENDRRLRVLFDMPDELNPAYNLCPDSRPDADGNPVETNSGTPRHPAYPSGHSTYSAAASAILNYFFGRMPTPPSLPFNTDLGSNPDTTLDIELRNLADNIGVGRLWAGVHWRSDHEAGQRLGRAVARLVIQQLIDMGQVKDPMDEGCDYKTKPTVVAFDYCGPRRRIVSNCDRSEEAQCEDMPPPERECLKVEADAIRDACAYVPKDEPKCCDSPVELDRDTPMSRVYDGARGVSTGGS